MVGCRDPYTSLRTQNRARPTLGNDGVCTESPKATHHRRLSHSTTIFRPSPFQCLRIGWVLDDLWAIRDHFYGVKKGQPYSSQNVTMTLSIIEFQGVSFTPFTSRVFPSESLRFAPRVGATAFLIPSFQIFRKFQLIRRISNLRVDGQIWPLRVDRSGQLDPGSLRPAANLCSVFIENFREAIRQVENSNCSIHHSKCMFFYFRD